MIFSSETLYCIDDLESSKASAQHDIQVMQNHLNDWETHYTDSGFRHIPENQLNDQALIDFKNRMVLKLFQTVKRVYLLVLKS